METESMKKDVVLIEPRERIEMSLLQWQLKIWDVWS